MQDLNEISINIVIPNWNGEWCIKRCIDSLLMQNIGNIDLSVTVVDNSSPDRSLDILEQYEKINLIKLNKNYGFATAINIGIRAIPSDYILILNNDTWLDDDFIKNALDEIRSKNVKVLGFKEAEYESDLIYYSGEDNYYTIDIFGYHTGVSSIDKSLFLCGVCLLFEKQIYEETGGFDSNFFMYLEEVDWFWRLNLYQIKYIQSDQLKVHHKRHGSSSNEALNYHRFLWRNTNTLRMLIKNYNLISLILILPIYFIISTVEFLYFISKGELKISTTYILGPYEVFTNLKNVFQARAEIQKKRITSDFEIYKKMYFGSAKLKQLRRK